MASLYEAQGQINVVVEDNGGSTGAAWSISDNSCGSAFEFVSDQIVDLSDEADCDGCPNLKQWTFNADWTNGVTCSVTFENERTSTGEVFETCILKYGGKVDKSGKMYGKDKCKKEKMGMSPKCIDQEYTELSGNDEM